MTISSLGGAALEIVMLDGMRAAIRPSASRGQCLA